MKGLKTANFFMFLQEKGVTIVAVGYGRRVKEETLIEIAGDNGHHLKFDDIGSFLKQVELIVSQTCGE